MTARTHQSSVGRCACGGAVGPTGECAACRAKRLQRQRRATAPAAAPRVVGELLHSPGRPLEPNVRADMEFRFGHDFSRVRVHTDAPASTTARAVDANAYAIGHDVVFDHGRYAPWTPVGRRLLAHELAHVLQQRGGDGPAPDAGHERNADALADDALSDRGGDRALPSGVGVARQGHGPLPAVTADELMERLVLAVRGFASSPSGIQHLVPTPPPPAPMGTGFQTYAAVQIIDRNGNQILSSIGAYLGRGSAHAEAGAVAALRRALPQGLDYAGARIMVVVDQTPCQGCASALETFAEDLGVDRLDVYVPSRPALSGGGIAGPKTSARTALFRGASARPEYSRTFTRGAGGARAAGPSTAGATEPTTTAAGPQSGATEPTTTTGGGTTSPPARTGVPTQVETNIRVLSSTQQASGAAVSEVEVTFGPGLSQVNAATPSGSGGIPQRMVIRITQNADGTLAAAESLTGEPASLAEGMARQLLAAGSRAASSEGGGTAAGTVAGGSRAASLLFRGVRWGGAAVFVVVTGYQLITATPEQRPRVVAQAGGGLAGGMAASFLVCNLLLDLETAGAGIVICGLVVGGAGGYLGSEAAGEAYDAATMSELDRALADLQAQPVNVRRLFYAMVARSGGAGVPIDESFVTRFVDVVPADLTEAELYALAGALGGVTAQTTLDGVLAGLRRAIDNLPTRGTRRPTFGGFVVTPPGAGAVDPTTALFGPLRTGITIGPPGPGRVRIFPGPGSQPTVGLPETGTVTPRPNLLEIELFP